MIIVIKIFAGLLIIVVFAVTFILGFMYGKQEAKKACCKMLVDQYVCLNWALQYVLPINEFGRPIDDVYLSKWLDDLETAKEVAKGDINAILSKE